MFLSLISKAIAMVHFSSTNFCVLHCSVLILMDFLQKFWHLSPFSNLNQNCSSESALLVNTNTFYSNIKCAVMLGFLRCYKSINNLAKLVMENCRKISTHPILFHCASLQPSTQSAVYVYCVSTRLQPMSQEIRQVQTALHKPFISDL